MMKQDFDQIFIDGPDIFSFLIVYLIYPDKLEIDQIGCFGIWSFIRRAITKLRKFYKLPTAGFNSLVYLGMEGMEKNRKFNP